jgi:putative hydrolase
MPGESPGGQNPFGFDMTEIMRMLQSPGPVNMEVARTTAETMATVDLETGEQRPEPAVSAADARAYDDLVQAVGHLVSDATGISTALTLPARGVARSEWSRTTLAGLEPVLGALATALGRADTAPTTPDETAALRQEAIFGMVMQQLVPLLLGAWAGSMIGMLSHRTLGQYDLPLPLEGAPTLLFVVPNVESFAHEWSLPIDELRPALALREVVHGSQRAVPWVRERLVRLASAYASGYEVNASAIEEQLGDAGFDPTDPSAMEAMSRLSDPELLLGAMRSERQVPLLEELQRFVSVLEGYTDIVVERLGGRVVGEHGRIDEALRRHRLEKGDATEFVDRLLGLELDRGHYDAGVAFCRGVIERTDGKLDALNRLWSAESMVPTKPELEAPGLWLARIELPDS